MGCPDEGNKQSVAYAYVSKHARLAKKITCIEYVIAHGRNIWLSGRQYAWLRHVHGQQLKVLNNES